MDKIFQKCLSLYHLVYKTWPCKDLSGIKSLLSCLKCIRNEKIVIIYSTSRLSKAVRFIFETQMKIFEWDFCPSIGSPLLGWTNPLNVPAFPFHPWNWFFFENNELTFTGFSADEEAWVNWARELLKHTEVLLKERSVYWT